MRYRIFHQIQSAIFSELKMLNVSNMSSQTRKIRDWYQTDLRIVATKITDSSNINSRFRQQNREFHLEIDPRLWHLTSKNVPDGRITNRDFQQQERGGEPTRTCGTWVPTIAESTPPYPQFWAVLIISCLKTGYVPPNRHFNENYDKLVNRGNSVARDFQINFIWNDGIHVSRRSQTYLHCVMQ